MTALLTALLSDVLPWLAAAAAALGGVWAYGRSQRAKVREEIRHEQEIASGKAKIDRAEVDLRAERAGRDANVEWLRANRRPK